MGTKTLPTTLSGSNIHSSGDGINASFTHDDDKTTTHQYVMLYIFALYKLVWLPLQ